MKYMKIWSGIIILFIYFLNPLPIHAFQNKLVEINGDFTKKGILFELDNLKPGDYGERKITIKNNRNKEILYDFQVLHVDGSEKLLHEFKLLIKQNDAILFDDKLVHFSSINDLPLKVNEEHNILLSFEFPSEAGNEFQGLHAEASFNIIAHDNLISDTSSLHFLSDSSPPMNTTLPQTATTLFSLLFIGSILLFLGMFIFLYRKHFHLSNDAKE